MVRGLKITPGEYIITNLGIKSNSVSIFITSDKKAIEASVLNVGNIGQYLWDLQPYGDGDWTILNKDSGCYFAVDNCGGDTGAISPKSIPTPWKIEEDPNNSDVLRIFSLNTNYAAQIKDEEGSNKDLELAKYDEKSDFQRWRIQPYTK